MKGQPLIRVNDTEMIRLISDNPGILSSEISSKCGVPVKTIQIKIKRLCDEKRVFKQTKKAFKGNVFPLYTMHDAKANHIPRLYAEKPEKTVLELQMMFNRLYRGFAA